MKALIAGLGLGLLLAAPAFAETYTFTDKSKVTFVATAPMRWNGVHGTSHDVRGKIEVPAGKFEQALVGIAIPIVSFEAKSGMDQHAFTALEAAKHPAVMFRGKSIVIDTKTETPEGVRLAGKINGLLNFHGVVQPITAPFTVVQGATESTIESEFKVSLSAHKVPPIRVTIIEVDDPVTIHLKLVAVKQSVQ